MVPMLSVLQQEAVWEGWLAGEIRANYFGDLCGRYHRQQQIATWLVLVASSGALVTVIGEWLPAGGGWLRPTLAATTAALSLWLLVAQNQKKATECSDLHVRWSTLANQYRSLWDDMYAEDAPQRLEALRQREIEIGKSSNAFPNKPKLMAKWQAHVQLHHATHTA